MDNEEKYLDISRKLKNLEPVKASDNFVHNLHSKIVEIEAEKRLEHEKKFDGDRGGFLKNLFGNMQYPWLVPAAGFTVLIFFVFYITFLNKNASENNQPLLSDQKTDISKQSNPPAEQNKTSETGNDKTLTGKENLPGKDIAGDLKTEKNERNPSITEEKKQYTDREETGYNKMELKAAQPEKNKDRSDAKNDEIKDFAKKENEPDIIENNGMIATEPQTGESSVSTESVTSNEPEVKLKSKGPENDSLKKKLDDKLRRINKSNLEKIREEILK
ncbi:MAG: hypothetical protein IPL53_08695 [Ignavibacteria bacterium]|nr:hypothetical protein [Ignavibacteria bacterium]